VIQLLHEKCLDSVTEYIFSLLNISCLKAAETVSKLWYSIIKKEKIWEKQYGKLNFKDSALSLLLQRRISEGFNIVDDEFLPKRLLNAYEKVQMNWTTGKNLKKMVKVGHCSRFIMDSNRIIVIESTLSVTMWNRWTLEAEDLPVQSDNTLSELTHLDLSEDLLFCSYRDGTIVAWDITKKNILYQFTDEIMSGFDLKIHIAHGLLVSFKTVAGDDWGCNQTMFSVRSLKTPSNIVTQEVTNRIPCARVKDVTSDDNYFIVFLFCSNHCVVSPDDFKIQLRSVNIFEVLREICGIMSSNEIFSYFKGWLVAGLTSVRVWDIEKGICQYTIPAAFDNSNEYEMQVADVQLDGEHLIIRDTSGTFTVWRFMTTNKQSIIPSKERINLLSSTSVTLSGERMKRGYQKFKFDHLQIVSVHTEEDDLNGPCDLLTIRNFF
jgi:WD40 repeat protein